MEVESFFKDVKSHTVTINNYVIHSSGSNTNNNTSLSDSKVPAVASSSAAQTSKSSVEASGEKKRKENPTQDNESTKVSKKKIAEDNTSNYNNPKYKQFANETFLRFFSTLPQRRILTEEEKEEGVTVEPYNEME